MTSDVRRRVAPLKMNWLWRVKRVLFSQRALQCRSQLAIEEETSIMCKKSEGEALRNIVNKLSDERNLKDLHLKHYHMSTAQFKKRTTHLDIPGRIYDLYQYVRGHAHFAIQ